MKSIYLLVLCLMLSACTSPDPTTPFPISATSTLAYKDLVITLERGPCSGNCALYQLTIYGDGTVEYLGRANVAVEGKRTSVLTRPQVEELVAAFDQADYFSLQDHYPESITLSGAPSTTISVTIDGRSKHIFHQGVGYNLKTMIMDATTGKAVEEPCMPEALCKLEARIDMAVSVAQWVGK